jgi:hypothetical protein
MGRGDLEIGENEEIKDFLGSGCGRYLDTTVMFGLPCEDGESASFRWLSDMCIWFGYF